MNDRRTAILSAIGGVAALCVATLVVVLAVRPAPIRALVEPAGVETPADFTYTIPPGTHDRVAAGENVAIFPDELSARVGQVLRLVNNDTEALTVGPFYVGAGETMVQRFTHTGLYQGICTVHTDGQVVIRVTA